MKLKLYCLLFIIIIFNRYNFSGAQTVRNYVFIPSSSTFATLTGATAVTLTGTIDEGYANNIPIGFTFYYNSIAYSSLAVSTNGFVSLGQNISSTNSFVNNLTAGTTPLSPRPILAPLWDNLSNFNTTDISYLTSGTAPNRVFTVQWLNSRWQSTAAGAGITFQLKLYEADSRVEFLYRPEAGALLSPSASIGITNAATGAGNFLSIISTGNNPYDTNTITETTTLNSKPASGQSYVFAPRYALPAAPAAPTFTSVSSTSMTINWIDNTNSETYYLVYSSSDNVNFSLLTTLNSNSVLTTGTPYQYSLSGLLTGTAYYFRIFACNEGSASTNYVSATQSTLPGLLSGVKTICPSGCDYTSIGSANTDIRARGVNGSLILEMDATYNPNVETYPLNFGNLYTNATNIVTLRPGSNVNSTINFVSVASPTFDFNGTNYLTIDGKKGGAGTQGYINISNLSSSGTAIRFINDATNNTLTNCRISGASASVTSGVITFASTAGTNGNSVNSIFSCIIKDTINNPIYAIYSSGNTNYPNVNNTLYGNDIYNYYNASNPTFGLYLTTGTDAWFIGANNFYQTAPRNLSGNTTGAIFLNGGASYIIFGNNIGGSGPNCSGSPMTYTGTGIISLLNFNLSTKNTCQIQNNIIQNINLNISVAQLHNCIDMINGAYSVTGNTIGSDNTNNSIVFNSSATGNGFIPIDLSGGTSYGDVIISLNTIGGITMGGSGSTQFRGISIAANVPNLTINDNLIGSQSNSNSIVDSTAQNLYGIFLSLGTTNNFIYGNNIANLSLSNTASTMRLFGIYANSGGSFSITGNTVRNLSTSGTSVLTGGNAPLIGIFQNASGLNQVCSGNTVYNLLGTNNSLPINVTGIYYSGTSSGSNYLSGNFVHGISSLSTAASVITGIYNGSSAVIAANNRVRLGIDQNGASINFNHNIAGINDGGNSNSYYHNSVYIGGGAVDVGSNNTYAFYNSISTTGTRNIQNNIFSNARANNLGSGKNYAIYLTSIALSGFTMNNNIYYAPGVGGTIGRFAGIDYTGFNQWRSVTFSDYNSGLGNPNFVLPTGTAATLDLRVQSPTPAEGSGTPISLVTDDFEGDVRSTNSPVDIGADAGNYTGVDIFSPSIYFIPLTNTASTANRVLTATISDVGTGVRNSGTLQPRIWYRRTLPTTSAWFNTGGVLASGNVMNGTWNFTIDYSLIGVAAVGNQFQYYIVAQDSATPVNLFYNSFPGANHTNVFNQVTAPTTPNSYFISNSLPTAISVGTGQTYTTLTGAGGLFTAINNGALAGNTTVTIVSDIAEPGTNVLTNSGLAGYNLLIKPDNTARVLSGTLVTGGFGLITLNGAKGVTIDGGVNKNLIIRNVIGTTPATNTAAAVYIYSGNNDTIRNCILESNNSQTGYAILMMGTSSAANPTSGVVVSKNIIRPPYNVNTNPPATAIIVNSGAGNISNCSFSGNQISDFNNYGIYLANSGSNNTIGHLTDTSSGNLFFQTLSRANHFYIAVGSGNNHIIGSNSIYGGAGVTHTGPVTGIVVYNNINNITVTNNSFGGNDNKRGGGAFTNAANITCINFSGGSLSTSTISNNRMANFSLSGTGIFTGISISNGNVNVNNNYIGGAAGSANLYDTISVTQDFYGIRYLSPSNLSMNNNLISNINNYGTGLTVGVSVELGVADIIGNTIREITTNATNNQSVDYSCTGIRLSNATSGNNVENNFIYNLSNLSNTNSVCVTGIAVMGAINSGNIQRNRIYNLLAGNLNTTTNSPIIRGIYIGSSGSTVFANNQITIRQSITGTQPRIRGIELNTGGGTNYFYYNSIYIGGVANSTNTSSSFYRNTYTGTASMLFKNNIFYNERTGGGTHFPFSANSNANLTHDFNLYVSKVASSMIEYAIGTGRSLASWNSLSGNPVNNYGYTNVQLPSAQLFPNLANGDLSSTACRISNAGVTVPVINDFNNLMRTSSPDLGSVEFTNATGIPTIDTHPANVNITCGPLNAQFNIVASGLGLAYQWEENRGSGWNSLTASALYTGVTTASLTLVNPTGSMNNYQYRCVVSGVCTPPATSNAATLTISNTNTWTGATSTAWRTASNWSCGVVPEATTDVLIPAVTNLPIIIDSAVCNNISINSSASLTLNNGNSRLNIFGQINLSGAMNNIDGMVIFSGSQPQTIPAMTFRYLKINNPSGVTLTGIVNVNFYLYMTSGPLVLGNYDLNMIGQFSLILNASSASNFIVTNGTGIVRAGNIGCCQVGAHTNGFYPVGSSKTSYNPVNIVNTGPAAGFDVRVFDSINYNYNASNVPIGVTLFNNAVNRTWFINSITGSISFTATMQWNVVDELPGFNRANCYAAKYNGTIWVPNTAGAATGSNPYSRTYTGNSNGLFGVGSGGSLPIELMDISATKLGEDVSVYWITASEINTSRFEVERSEDSKTFERIGEVEAKGNSGTISNYQFTDLQVFGKQKSGLNAKESRYYRLKMLDMDESYSYSKVVSVSDEDQVSEEEIKVYPNPLSDVLNILVTSGKAEVTEILIFDISGKLIYKNAVNIGEGSNLITLKGEQVFNNGAQLGSASKFDLNPGIYFISMETSSGRQVRKLVKQ